MVGVRRLLGYLVCERDEGVGHAVREEGKTWEERDGRRRKGGGRARAMSFFSTGALLRDSQSQKRDETTECIENKRVVRKDVELV